MTQARALKATMAGVLLVALVGLPLSQVTDSGLERRVKSRLGIGTAERCGTTTASPGWAGVGQLPEERDEPRAVALDGRIYLVGGIRSIVDYGKPSDVPGVAERVEVEAFDNLTAFDPASGRYEELPPLPEPLNHVGFVTHQGALYVVGGHGKLLLGAEPKSSLYRYEPGSRSWSKLAPMPTARGAVAVGVVGDVLYVAGGMRSGRAVRTVEAYDFKTGRWRRVADMPRSREHAAGAVVGGRFYVVGGRDLRDDSLETVERYDAARDAWEPMPPLPQPSGGLEAFELSGALVAMGGGDDRERWVTGAVQRLDPRTRTWSRLADMRTPRHGFGAAVADGSVWTFGGSPCALFAASDIVERFTPPGP